MTTATAHLVLRARDETQRAFRAFRGGMGGIQRVARQTALAVSGMATAVAFAGVRAAGTADELAKTIRASGLAADEFQALAFQAKQAGMEQGAYNSSMEAFNRRLGQAAQGTGAALRQYEAMGVSIRDQNGDLRSNMAILRDVADRLRDIRDPAERAAIASDLFGRSGMRMADVLAGGSDEIDHFRDQAESLGLIISQDILNKAEEASDQLGIMSEVIRKRVIIALSDLFPVIIRAGEGFVTALGHAKTFFDFFDDQSEVRRFGRIAQIDQEIQELQARMARDQEQAPGFARFFRGRMERQIEELQAEKETLEREIAADRQAAQQAQRDREAAFQDRGPGLSEEDMIEAESNRAASVDRSVQRELDAIRRLTKTREQILREDAERRKQLIEENVENELERGQLLLAVERDLVEQLHQIRSEHWQREEEVAERHSSKLGDTLGDGLVAGMEEGSSGVKRVFERMLTDLAAQMIRSQVMSMLGGLGGGGGGGGSLGGLVSGFRSLVGFSGGGSFRVPGHSGTDTVVPLFRARSGETVDIRPPGGGQSGGGLQLVMNITNTADATVTAGNARQDAITGQWEIDMHIERKVSEMVSNGKFERSARSAGYDMRRRGAR